MKVLEAANDAVRYVSSLSHEAGNYPSESVKNRLRTNIARVSILLPEDCGLSDQKGSLELLKPLVMAFTQNGQPGLLNERKNLRKICHFLDSRELIDPPLLPRNELYSLLEWMSKDWSDSYLLPLILTVLRNYALTGSNRDRIRAIETLITERIAKYSGSRRILQFAARHSGPLFEKSDPGAIALILAKKSLNYFEACSTFGFSDGILNTKYFGFVLIAFAKRTSNPAQFLADEAFSHINNLCGANVLKILVAILIEKLGGNSEHTARLTSVATIRVGDPMVEAHWKCTGIEYAAYQELINSARSKVLAWINSQVVDYFFSKVSMNDGRKAFWRKYAGKMDMIRVAMHVGYGYDMRLSGNSELNTWIKSRLIRVDQQTADIALIMEYKDTAIIEFGAAGNACYFYDKRSSYFLDISNKKMILRSLGSLKVTSLPIISENKMSVTSGRLIHNGEWEYKFKTVLRNMVGLSV